MSRRAETFIVDGRVQKVGYRWWAANEARWVRNRHDGSRGFEPKATV